MSLMEQDTLGRCDFIDVLEEAVLRRQPVGVKLKNGEAFIDVVVDVVTEDGLDYAVFRRHKREAVPDVAAVTREEPAEVAAD